MPSGAPISIWDLFQHADLVVKLVMVGLLVEAHVRVAFVCGGRARPIPKALRMAMRPDQERMGG